MKKVYRDTFEQDYPYLTKTRPIECGDGWYDLLRDLFAEVDEVVRRKGLDKESIHFSQIKEKFGSLRAYIHGGDEEILKIISKYEGRSNKTCEGCGSKGSPTTDDRWMLTLCGACKQAQGRT